PEALHPDLSALLTYQKCQQVNNANNFWGRLIQTHYAEKERDYAKYGYDPRAQAYMEIVPEGKRDIRTIYHRTKNYFLGDHGLQRFPQALMTSDKCQVKQTLSPSEIAIFFKDFLMKPTVVELVHPSFAGATTKAANAVIILTDALAKN